MKRWISTVLAVAGLALALLPTTARADRIKDLTTVAAKRTNQLIGYGLVVGLQGTGDGADVSFTAQSMKAMLGRMGVALEGALAALAAGPPVATAAAASLTALVAATGRALADADVAGATLPHTLFQHQSVNDDFNAMRGTRGQPGHRILPADFHHDSVNARPKKPLPLQPLQYVPKLSALIQDQGRKQHDPRVFRKGQNSIHDLFRGKSVHRLPRTRIVGLTDGGIQQPQVIVNFSRRGDGRARVSRGMPLLDRDGWG
jgi:hypothetical protein